MLTVEQLEVLTDKILERVYRANRTGELESMLEAWGMSDLLEPEAVLQTFKDGKILIIGESAISEEIITMVAGKAGIDRSRLELYLGYDEAKTFNYKKLQYNSNYRVIIFGHIPHKTVGTADSSSVIAELEKRDMYPRVIRPGLVDGLKITKSSIKKVFEDLIAEGYI